MKRMVVLFFILLLAACKPEEVVEQLDEFIFNGETYTYSDTTSQGYEQYVGNGHLIEINCDEYCIISFEINEDVYIITGTSATYDVTKNGAIILIDGEEQTPTGIENPDWNSDILPIIKAYEK